MRDIVIVGGGYVGLYTAWQLERRLRRGEATVTLLDPRPYMTYQPFLPEVVSGAIEPRHAVVSLRRHLRRTRVLPVTATRVDHQHKIIDVTDEQGHESQVRYDVVVLAAGVVTRTLPIPGLAAEAIGMKTIEEAVAIRDRLLTAFDRASSLPAGPARRRALTVVFVGGGFAGVEGFGETLSLATELLAYYPELRQEDLSFHLIEAQGRILPEVGEQPARWVVDHLQQRGGRVHLDTRVLSAIDGHLVLSTGEELDADLIVWTAGNAANPVLARVSGLPVDDRGYVVTRPDLRVGTESDVIADAWAAGDDAAVPDLARGGTSLNPPRLTVPNAQHAVRQAKRLAANIVATLRGQQPTPYRHHSLGVVATLGRGSGLFQYHRLVITGWPAWAMHRAYHLFAVPSGERKLRVALGWLAGLLGRRDIASLAAAAHPRRVFAEAAAGRSRRTVSLDRGDVEPEERAA